MVKWIVFVLFPFGVVAQEFTWDNVAVHVDDKILQNAWAGESTPLNPEPSISTSMGWMVRCRAPTISIAYHSNPIKVQRTVI